MDRELTLEETIRIRDAVVDLMQEGLFALCEEPPFGTIKNEEEML